MSETETITVVMGRFEPLVSYGLKHVLGADGRLCVLGSGLEGSAIERAVAQRTPRVAILDETVEHELLARLKSRQPGLGILVLANSPAPITGTTLLAAGAACLTRAASPADILAAVHLVAEGEPIFCRAEDDQLARRGPVVADVLTKRETEVFELLRMGKPYARIGRALQIAPETVRTHTISICRKLNVKSKQELIGMSLSTRLESLA
ncbi:MAG: LuxR C-terminal-related transcriptional regulator [Solirubrobacteraceae bacterium]